MTGPEVGNQYPSPEAQKIRINLDELSWLTGRALHEGRFDEAVEHAQRYKTLAADLSVIDPALGDLYTGSRASAIHLALNDDPKGWISIWQELSSHLLHAGWVSQYDPDDRKVTFHVDDLEVSITRPAHAASSWRVDVYGGGGEHLAGDAFTWQALTQGATPREAKVTMVRQSVMTVVRWAGDQRASNRRAAETDSIEPNDDATESSTSLLPVWDETHGELLVTITRSSQGWRVDIFGNQEWLEGADFTEASAVRQAVTDALGSRPAATDRSTSGMQ